MWLLIYRVGQKPLRINACGYEYTGWHINLSVLMHVVMKYRVAQKPLRINARSYEYTEWRKNLSLLMHVVMNIQGGAKTSPY